jgi:hypothetical protein
MVAHIMEVVAQYKERLRWKSYVFRLAKFWATFLITSNNSVYL